MGKISQQVFLKMPEMTGLAIFCDDIRSEMGGKVSYMGIYGQDMVISGPKPTLLPKLSIAAHIQIPSEVVKARLKVSVMRSVGGTSEELVSMEGDIERPAEITVDANTFTQAIVHLNAVPFHIADDCDIKVRAFIDGKKLKLGTLPIRFIEHPHE